jgi:hypothetical protein
MTGVLSVQGEAYVTGTVLSVQARTTHIPNKYF